MSYWLLLYRINVSRNHFAVDQEVEFATNILSDSTESNLSFGNVTVPRACCASYPCVRESLVQLRLSYHITPFYWAEYNFSNTTAHAIMG